MTAVPLNNSTGKPVTAQQSAQVLIAEYKAAYVAANKNPAPEITYAGGWFTVKNAGYYGTKYRRHAIERFRNALLERAAS